MQRRTTVLILVAVVFILFEVSPSNGTLDIWSMWGDRAFTLCKNQIKRDSRCEMFQEVVEEAFHDMSLKLSEAMSKDLDDLTKTSLKQPFRSEGERIIKDAAKHMVSNKIRTEGPLREYFMKQFTQWLMNVAAGNAQNMMQNRFQGMSVEQIQAAIKSGAMKNMDKEEEKEFSGWDD
eukprot:TRINITY_DN2236_c0_g1_i1.p1 TRINITY_DN2236_c0_g1~~TRINITY_DN2236_c0_g1_i1.p1  ORF type:complete len:177 (-),score=39.53 TRINITY_DN2236_c0_g1_i1:65-595(-)